MYVWAPRVGLHVGSPASSSRAAAEHATVYITLCNYQRLQREHTRVRQCLNGPSKSHLRRRWCVRRVFRNAGAHGLRRDRTSLAGGWGKKTTPRATKLKPVRSLPTPKPVKGENAETLEGHTSQSATPRVRRSSSQSAVCRNPRFYTSYIHIYTLHYARNLLSILREGSC